VSFEDLQLHPALLKALQECGYTEPMPVQAIAIPKILAGQDLIATAETGMGKTAAFVIPALQNLFTHAPKKSLARKPYGRPSVLVLTPTRELANQISEAIRIYSKFMRCYSVNLVGGVPYVPQFKSLARPVDIIVATPGRLRDHIEHKRVDLSGLSMLVLDEADRMLDMGFIDDVEMISALTPESRQTLFFTATWDVKMAQLASRLLKNPERVQVETQVTHKNIEQRLHFADNVEHKNRLLQHLISDDAITQAIIFSATKQGADILAQQLVAQGHSAAALHGDMKQSARNRTIMQLRRGQLRLLVATDVAARGLDVTTISHVINFDLPRFAEDYVHRIGRTGRAGAGGTAISFALPDDLPHLQRIERYTGARVPQFTIPGLEPTVSSYRQPFKKRRPFSSAPPRKNFSTFKRRRNV